MFIRCLGTIPGPIFFGYLFDNDCLLWQESCSERGSCWIYDSVSLSHKMVIVGVIFKSCTVVFYILALCFYRPPTPSLYKQLTNEESDPENNPYASLLQLQQQPNTEI